MNNLFIMHTQYNLILAAGIALRHPDDNNTLVLYSEFSVSDEMICSLKKVFQDIVVVNDRFRMPQRLFSEIKHIWKCLSQTRRLWKRKFDVAYLSQERVFDLALLGKIRKYSKCADCIAIEEDAYYSINNLRNSESYVPCISRRVKITNWIMHAALCGFPYDYKELIYCYGMHSVYSCANLLFPEIARKELQGKKLIEVTIDDVIAGIRTLYSEIRVDYPQNTKYVVVFMDLMNRYHDKALVKTVLLKTMKMCAENGRTILIKYHPRETDRFEIGGDVHEINMIIPAEKVLLDLRGKDTLIVGNATTACRVAAKMGYRVYSICKIDAPQNKCMHDALTQMGIHCIDNYDELEY